ncbi:hypothetical protein FJ651_07880 [Paucihalobacter ruber]|uniref:Type I restriction modification DNA specificity domain-containing protein n=1 Tax=Paucihalobacter ruber TaxID=2567861 RepID=A0A506PKD0_9FLAO|nr:restriction endonuclease subunit S [Paucihalobacter ruber]TPV34069.1 hypothetical protein FJ651_07880 [Paucihalobacter ruber]
MIWKTETFGSLLTESRIPCENPDIEKRIRVKLNVQGVEKRPVGAEKEGATKQFIRKAGQFIYGKQNFHKGAFGVIPEELDGFETSADIPSFDVREDCLPEWIYYFFKAGNRYLELTEYARGVGSQRIHPKQLQNLEIPLPSIEFQRKIIEELVIIEKDEISTELTHQLDLVKQLRQAFLREAMQGKLVPQDEKDEPASELLEKIKAEKERLIQEKKIKKQKPLPPITAEEIPFEIPENWVWCRLGELASIVRGGSPRPAGDPRYYGGNIPFLKVGDLTGYEGKFCDTHTYTIKEEGLYKTRFVEANTLMLTNSGATLGVPRICTFPTTFNDGIAAFLGIDKLNKEFLFYFLREKSDFFLSEASRGQGQPNLNTDIISFTLIGLPPVNEQQRIVAKLDELMQYCDELEASIKESQQQNELLLQQVLREALEPSYAEAPEGKPKEKEVVR